MAKKFGLGFEIKRTGKGFDIKRFTGVGSARYEVNIREGTIKAIASRNDVLGSDLSQSAKSEKVSKALTIGSKKAGTFGYKDARKRA